MTELLINCACHMNSDRTVITLLLLGFSINSRYQISGNSKGKNIWADPLWY